MKRSARIATAKREQKAFWKELSDGLEHLELVGYSDRRGVKHAIADRGDKDAKRIKLEEKVW